MNRNIYLKYLLRDLWILFPKNKTIKALRKEYMDSKSVNPDTPLKVLKELAEPHIEAFKNKDLGYFVERQEELPMIVRPIPSMLDSVTEEQREQLWSYMHSLLFETVVEPTTDLQLANTVGEISDTAQMEKMIAATTSMMPQIFRQLGMEVSEEEINNASKQIQDRGLLKLFSTMMK